MKLVIVDDDILVATALKTILEGEKEVEIAAIGGDGEEAIRLYKEHKPDVLLMDIRMKKMDGIKAAKKIIREDEQAKILLLTTFSDDEYIIDALKAGVKGYILKQDYENIFPSIRAVCAGQSVFGNEISNKIPDLIGVREPFDYNARDISGKEHQVMALVANGLSNKEIAQELFLSEGTVRNYLSVILEKLELRDRTQLAIFYLNNDRKGD